MTKKCYMCDKDATTVEHVPPRCIFPELKDSNGIDYKKNLITVPSCEEHNNSKSTDDTYLRDILSMVGTSSSLGKLQFTKKTMKQASRRPALMNDMLAKSAPYEVSFDDGATKQPTFGIRVDDDRLQNSFECMARALYYHEKNEKFSGESINVFPLFLFNKELQEEREQLANVIDSVMKQNSILQKGGNPDIFYYQFYENSDGSIFIKMVFYGNARCYIVME